MPDLTSLPDYSALVQVQHALWGSRDVRGAAVMVGAGFSRFAQLASPDGRMPPLWRDFASAMGERLDGENLPSDPLILAEQYSVALGRHALDALIRDLVPDNQWTPSDLHTSLLGLPWADVLTTNWDTLLERTQLEEHDRSYEIVRVISDIARTRAPRIVKLHGTLPSHEPFIFTAEDFRTYPRRFAPFVNLAQQVLLENELCLIGFSGDDPNFLQWSGWVRDQLGISARKIRLIGVLDLSPSRRQMLEHHNISPIDLAPLVEGGDPYDRHRSAMAIFLESLWAAKPKPRHVWNRKRARNPSDKLAGKIEAELFLQEVVRDWKSDRVGFPGWLVAPPYERMMIRHDTSSLLMDVWNALKLAESDIRVGVAYELMWRCEISFMSISGSIKALIEEVLQKDISVLDVSQVQDMQLALLRSARRDREWNEFDLLAAQLVDANRSEVKLALAYERALRCRDELDYEGLTKAIDFVRGDDPVWGIRRSALLCELGEHTKAAESILGTWNEIRLRRSMDRESVWLLSREAWAAWLMNRARFTLRDRPDVVGKLAGLYERWPVKYKAADCDPWDETTYFDHEMSSEVDRRIKSSETFHAHFDAGTYRDKSQSVQTGGDNSLFEELVMLTDHIGLSDEIGNADVVGGRVVRGLELLQEVSEKHIWSAVLHLPGKEGLIDRYFSRNAVARLDFELVNAIAKRLQQAINYGRNKFDDIDWISRTARHVELLSRLVVRLPADNAKELFRWAMVLSDDKNWTHWWIFEPLHHLLTRSLEAIPPADHHELALSAIQLKLPSEVNIKGLERHWPELAFLFKGADYAARDQGHAWSHRIAALIEVVRSQVGLSRARAIWRLAAMHEAGVLTDVENVGFGEALWGQRAGEDGFPDHSDLYGQMFLRLPEPQPGLAMQTFLSKVVAPLRDADLSEFGLVSLSSSALDSEGKLISAPLAVSDALSIFDSCLGWRPRQVDSSDLFRLVRRRNKELASHIGPCLLNAILPVLSSDDVGHDRKSQWVDALRSGVVESLVQTAPELARIFPDCKEAAVSFVRRGLSSRVDLVVDSAAWAVIRFIRYHSEGIAIFPSVLAGDMVAICSARRDPGLLLALNTARRLLRAGLLSAEDIARLCETLESLLMETAYKDWDDSDLRTRSLSLIRRDCVRLAYTLNQQGAEGSGLAAWLELPQTDPVPEVRFALDESREWNYN